MRPLRLELRGFTAFREEQVIDFGDADYFALVGPTGAGKSTVIDAICFALYGSVPRLNDRRAVAPVISQGGIEARVRFDFSLGGSTYSAVRVVTKDAKGGANTREARLECDGEVLAGRADELSREVERLLGLPFDHFTRCVVLPQGEFARFLHDNRTDRQGLLVKLLRLGIYKNMGEAARRRALEAEGRAEHLQARLDGDLAFATKQALDEAKQRWARLEGLRDEVEKARPRLDELSAGVSEAHETVARLDGLSASLAAVVVPPDVAELADRLTHLSKLVHEAEDELEGAEQKTTDAERDLDALPPRDPVVAALNGHEDRGQLAAEARTQRTAESSARDIEQAARRAFEDAEVALETALGARDDARAANAAHDLAGSLVKGEPCPVCLQVVEHLPTGEAVPELERAGAVLVKASEAKAEAQRRLGEASGARSAVEGRLQLLESQIAAHDERLRDAPGHTEAKALLASIDSVGALLEGARKDVKAARAGHKKLTSDLQDQKAIEQSGRQSFEALRDRLIPLEPPPRAGSDLAADWAELVAWAGSTGPEVAGKAEGARHKADELTNERATLMEGLEASCRDCEVDLAGAGVEPAVVAALTRAEGLVDRLEEGLKNAAGVRGEIKKQKHEGDVAAALGGHLRVDKFESWMVNQALQRLVEGGGAILRELTNGTYSLGISEAGDFQVVDHHNADEVRSARTLSGGETFLASLSLALALADHLAQLAAGGAARLEAIFLDEGFGTLDPDTLDTVAATVQNLAAGGRMVGIVTHVRELADQVPVQFRVTKDAHTARVEKVAV